MSNDDIQITQGDTAEPPINSSPIPTDGPGSSLSVSPDPPKDSATTPTQPTEILHPTLATMRISCGKPTSRAVRVMAALTTEALWIQETWTLRRVLLSNISHIELSGSKNSIVLTIGPDNPAETVELTFSVPGQGERWAAEVLTLPESADPDAARERRQAEGVTLVRGKAEVPHTVLGRVKFTDQSSRRASWGLRLRAGMLGADAVIEVVSRKCTDLGPGGREFSGLAVRVGDDDALKQLRMRSYGHEILSLFNRCIALITIQAVVLGLASLIRFGRGGGLEMPTGETRSEMMESLGLGLAIVFAWPIIILALIRILYWPQLLRATGLAILAATTLRGVMVIAAHLLAVATTGATLAESKLWFLIDPVDWAFIIMGGALCARAWRLANETRQLLPPELQVASPARKGWSRVMVVASVAYTLFVLGVVGWYRYEASTYVLQPGVDVKREHEALLALNEGVDQLKKGDLLSAERSFLLSLKLWEELTTRQQAPPVYKRNLAATLYNLGWIRESQARPEEAKKYYSRCVAIVDELAGDPVVDNDFKLFLADARKFMAQFQTHSADDLDEKGRVAGRKYEEAQVKASKGDAAAEHLYQESILTWEAIFPQATNAEYRRTAVAQLAEAHLLLGEFQKFLGKRPEAEASLRKAVEYGERALTLEPDRPLVRHNLEVARGLLMRLREQAHQDALSKLLEAQRFTDAVDLFRRGLAEAEEQFRAGKDHDLAARLLAYRLDRFARFLGHNPVVLDTKAALGYARRATELQPAAGDYWFTLGLLQYRNGDWRESLASLDQVRGIEGENDGSGLLLIAMNRHRLGQRKEALTGLRNATEWIDKRRQEAEKDAVQLFYYEQTRPALEALRLEAENLIEGKQRTID